MISRSLSLERRQELAEIFDGSGAEFELALHDLVVADAEIAGIKQETALAMYEAGKRAGEMTLKLRRADDRWRAVKEHVTVMASHYPNTGHAYRSILDVMERLEK